MTNKKLYLAGFGALSALSYGCAESQPTDTLDRPNILMIVCEDISPYLGCYGDPIAKTPNLDNFAKESIRFTDMHTTVGVSAPSRFALISGMYPSAMGANYMRTYSKELSQFPTDLERYYVVLPDEIKGYPEYMREAGYYCTNNFKNDYQFNAPLSMWDENDNTAHWRHCPDDMPFFSIFNLGITHEGKVWIYGNKPLAVNPDDITPPPYYPNDEITRHDMAVMYSNVNRMDQQFQALVDDLKESGRYDNTIIIFMSDNGGPLPRQKRSVYESGTHVPFMIHFPNGYRAGEVEDRLAMFIDIPATILSLAGIETPDYMHGEAFLGKYKESKEREYVYAARDRMDERRDKQGAVRDKRYRYIRNYTNNQPNYMDVKYRRNMKLMSNLLSLRDKGELNETQMRWFSADRPAEEFYDDINDPHNVHNLIDDPAYQKDIERLRKEHERWVLTYNKRWLLSEQESRALMLPGDGKQPILAEPTMAKSNKGVTLTTNNKGASLVYKINDKGYNDNTWYLYTKTIEGLKQGDKITAVATRAGYVDSPELTFVY